MRIAMALILLFFSFGVRAECSSVESLSDFIVILDPGHGGKDRGALGHYIDTPEGRYEILEDEHVYDVALRIKELLKSPCVGARVEFTIYDTEQMVPHNGVFVHDENEYFAHTGERVQAGENKHLRNRASFANIIKRDNPDKKVVFISLHFDVASNRSDLSGAMFHTTNGYYPALLEALRIEFKEAGLSRTCECNRPAYDLGDQNHYVYRKGVNLLPQRVLIELGNFLNERDKESIIDPAFRELLAMTIVNALYRIQEVPLDKFHHEPRNKPSK